MKIDTTAGLRRYILEPEPSPWPGDMLSREQVRVAEAREAARHDPRSEQGLGTAARFEHG